MLRQAGWLENPDEHSKKRAPLAAHLRGRLQILLRQVCSYSHQDACRQPAQLVPSAATKLISHYSANLPVPG